MISFKSITSVKALFPNTVAFWGTGALGLHHVNFERDIIQAITKCLNLIAFKSIISHVQNFVVALSFRLSINCALFPWFNLISVKMASLIWWSKENNHRQRLYKVKIVIPGVWWAYHDFKCHQINNVNTLYIVLKRLIIFNCCVCFLCRRTGIQVVLGNLRTAQMISTPII